MDIIKVSANSRTSAGAGAVNQAVKAWTLATGYLKLDGIDVVCVPEFVEVTIDDKVRTAIKMVIEAR
jgi:stage V sporulation protein S